MSIRATKKLQPLLYESYECLRKRAFDIDKELLASLKRLDNYKRFKYLLEAEREGRMKMQDGDEENAYIMYHRAMAIYRFINDSMTDAFKRSRDGRLFYETSGRLLLDLERVAESLRQRFGQRQLTESTVGSSKSFSDETEVDASLSSHNAMQFKKYAKPAEIVRFVANGMNALVLDYRENQTETIEYKSTHGTIKVVHISRRDIMPGSLLHSLFKALDISVRPLLENISHVDLVALLGDPNDITDEKGTKTTILMEALTTYNFNYKLKRPPVIIDGGFMNWKNVYPYYVNETSDVPRFEKTFDEQFAIWIVESRKANELRIQYPSLSGFARESVPSDCAAQQHKQVEETPIIQNRIQYPSLTGLARQSVSSDFSAQQKQIEEKPIIRNKPNHRSDSEVLPLSGALQQPIPIDVRKQVPPIDVHKQVPTVPVIDRSKKPLNGCNVRDQQPRRPPQRTDDGTGNYFLSAYSMSAQRIGNDSEWKKTPLGRTGLFNMGNTCFMNATLHPLFHTPGFSQLFQEKNAQRFVNGNNTVGSKGIISGSFSALIDLFWSGKFNAIRPQVFLEFFAQRVNAELADRQQHDAQEFQLYLLDALHEDTNRVDRRQPFEQNYDNANLRATASDFFERSKLFSSSPVNDIFNLTTISMVQCSTCNASSVRFEEVNQISVELPTNIGCLKLKDCLGAHFSLTNLEAPWDCPKCKSKQPATRSTKIWRVPKVLIVHLKRFSQNNGNFVKNEAAVTFDVNELDLSPYVHEKSPLFNATFSLYAITNHSGRLNSGHYTSAVVNLISTDREWLNFDDESCMPCVTPSHTSKKVFLLYYKLTNSKN
ncbi:hypothetical protein niasHT_007546 [Heterodera trifolii]|uniref:ubiquitinyl hydrolase 1 n=1 Tax=Heterodera trifolii TaxID=157864 RepID=A0ABD2LPG6_9BILA